MIEFDCPNCQRHLHVPNDLGGRRAPCPQCQVSLRIPELDEIVAPAERPAPPPAPELTAPPEPEPTPSEPEAKPTPVEPAPPQPTSPQEQPPPTPPAEAETPLPVFGVEPVAEPEAPPPTVEPELTPEAPGPGLSGPEIEAPAAEAPTLDLEELIAAEQSADIDEALSTAPPERPARPTKPPRQARVVRAAPRLKESPDDAEADDTSSSGPGPRGFDVAALILGIVAVACSPLGYLSLGPAALTVVFAILGLAQAKRTRSKRKALAGLALGCAGGVLSVLTALNMVALLPTLQDHRDTAARELSAAQLQRIGDALAEHVLTRGNQISPDLQTLVDEGLLDAERLRYPGLGSGRASDYFYLAPAKDAPLDAIVICEFIDCGRSDERLFLRFNGEVGRATETKFQKLAGAPQNQAFFEALRRAEAQLAGADGGGTE